jgi:outer membrane protein OmpA-like peptidoglycan-associated protein
MNSLKRAVVAVLILSMFAVSGCSSNRTNATIAGASMGALAGGAMGCGAAAAYGNHTQSEAYEIGCPAGVGLGAIIGGVIGYTTYHPAPPPPPVVAQAPPPPPPPPPPPVREKIVLRGVHFDFNRAVIRPDADPILDEADEILKSHPDVKVDVNGYCDSIGSFPYNLRLSQRRAEAVAGYLTDRGISSDRLITHGYGKTDFVATNATPEGRAQNRRVELIPEE